MRSDAAELAETKAEELLPKAGITALISAMVATTLAMMSRPVVIAGFELHDPRVNNRG